MCILTRKIKVKVKEYFQKIAKNKSRTLELTRVCIFREHDVRTQAYKSIVNTECVVPVLYTNPTSFTRDL